MNEIKEIVLPDLTNDNVIEGDLHVLFKEEVQPTFERLAVDEPDVGEIYEKIDGYTKYKLFIADFNETGKGTQKIVNELQKGVNEGAFLEIHVASNGGVIDELIEYTNLISNFYQDTITYLNYGYSAGAIMFLLGNERVVYEHSSFMIHSYSGGAYGKRDDMIQQLEHTDKRISDYFNKTLKKYFTKKEMKRMAKGKDFWLDSKEMLKRGIATHIIVDGKVKTADEYLNPKKTKKIKPIKKEKTKKEKK